MFAAASNHGARSTLTFPASSPYVIAVHSVNTYGSMSHFSPTASLHSTCLATVGEGVKSALLRDFYHDQDSLSRSMAVRSGTSYSTPIMAAIAGFLLLYVRTKLPELARHFHYLAHGGMEKLLMRIARKGSEHSFRDGYYFVDLNCDPQNLFSTNGADDPEPYILEEIRRVLRQ